MAREILLDVKSDFFVFCEICFVYELVTDKPQGNWVDGWIDG